jgi:D-alanyl-D-alanine carboxypeptidase (penicillin-binding protein 5/6)
VVYEKILWLLLLLIVPLTCKADELATSASAGILMEYSTGKILYEKNSDEKLAPASMTNIMTT